MLILGSRIIKVTERKLEYQRKKGGRTAQWENPASRMG
jgi:hypothetical protein